MKKDILQAIAPSSIRQNMKSISASIIVLAGAAVILGSAHIQHGDTRTFVQSVGCVVAAVGLWGWFKTLKEQ
jgi:hypothetical protein